MSNDVYRGHWPDQLFLMLYSVLSYSLHTFGNKNIRRNILFVIRKKIQPQGKNDQEKRNFAKLLIKITSYVYFSFIPQKCPFLPTEGTNYFSKVLAYGRLLFYSNITKLYYFINEMCHFTKLFACGKLWFWATLPLETSTLLWPGPKPPSWKCVDLPLIILWFQFYNILYVQN